MQNGWVKLHRNINENKLLASDNTAWIVFTKLLTVVDKDTGAFTTGRKRLAALTNLKKGTLYSCLQRMERQSLISHISTGSSTTIYICNWEIHQQLGQSSISRSSTLNKKEKENIDTNVSIGDQDRSPGEADNNKQDKALFEALTGKLGQKPCIYTAARKTKLKQLLKYFSAERLLEAAGAIADDPFMTGDNPENRNHATVKYLLDDKKSVEKVEYWLTRQDGKPKSRVQELLDQERQQ